MEVHQALPYLRETLLFLALTGVLIPLLQRFRINQVLGFLAAGTLVGPFGLGLWTQEMPALANFTFPDRSGVAALAEFGVLFLMFMIGLELSAERLWALRRWVFGAGTAQVAISAALIGLLAWLFGNPVEVAVILGVVLALSSTAVVMQLMNEQRTLGTPLGRAGFSILMLQDLAVVPLLILMGVLAKGSSEGVASLVLLTLLKSVGAILLIYLLGRRVIRPMFHAFARQRQPDVFMALTLLSTLGIAALTEMAGLSMALGAFLAGLLLAETEFKHEVEVTIEPFKGLLMGLFFMSVGMAIDVREIMKAPLLLPLSVLGLFAIKTAVIALILRIGGFGWGRAIEGGTLLGQGGEFTFIVVGQAIATQLMPEPTGQFIMLVVSLSLFATPMVAKAGVLLRAWLERSASSSPEGMAGAAEVPQPAAGRIIIAGYGRVGQLVGQMAAAQGIPYVAFETDARLVGKLHALGLPVYFGDAARLELLRTVKAEEAAAIVLTMDHPASALHAVKAIRREYPRIPIYARSRDEKHAVALRHAGATQVIPETLEAGLQLSALVLQGLGMSEGGTAHVIQLERERRIQEIS
ncbi:monovalent cation:proton antiporter-2 (CPA2) family protein [Noviherbaspirillum sp. CPCC 100848]|uniref:Monovalent cation:proton antiporter-2 (CPA2) family protein n=1 Tax=Noviherbaspirillum album TaxID=3080276 RepID=A0ABU6JAE9_9BURK|nr:monovalent cation:proton antiporter-2 (CPA2) family protein [Noviherbaspirillum sp. CPCC 100848]MEC4720624.1 monovalent cation:proton antiporter-2 (CPA2) family protein [Noviherbaspirillum sp. CPCC 100848]